MLAVYFVVALLAGALVTLDHFGLLGFEVHVASAGRLLGCGLLLTGIGLIWKF